MSSDLLLVGSVPLDTAEGVFRAFGPSLGRWLAYLPDGEVGDRRYWVDGLAHRVLNPHPDLETTRRPAPGDDGVENWHPRGNHDNFQFRVKSGVTSVRFGDPGWRLGYARDALNSYAIFRYLKRDGVIPDHVRFQVCMPLTYSAIGGFFADPGDQAKVTAGMTAALRSETGTIVSHIPHEELALQWDLAIENRFVERRLAQEGLEQAREEARRVCEPAAEICSAIPADVAVGFHSCFGTLDGWPSRSPADLTGTVLLLNAACGASGRPVDFVHFPTTRSEDERYFRPLGELAVGGARVYVGAIHHDHGPGGLGAQLDLVRRVLPEFGLAAPCGWGRAPERPGKLLSDDGGLPPDHLRAIIDDHIQAVSRL